MRSLRLFGPAELSGTPTELYEATDTSIANLIHVSNPTGSPVQFQLSIGTDAAARRIVNQLVPAGVTDYSGYYVLEEGDVLEASGDGLVLCVNGQTAAAEEPVELQRVQLLLEGLDRVDWDDAQQEIDGFGAADTNVGNDDEQIWSDSTADLLFDTDTGGGGFTLMRLQLATYSGTEILEHKNSTKATARGVNIWCAPWSAPAAWKTIPTLDGAGHLLPERYNDWANILASAQGVLQMYDAGVLYAVSMQNEPDFAAGGHPSMVWTNAEMIAFIKVLGPKLAALTPRPRLLAGEFSNADNLQSFVDALIADPDAGQWVDIVAYHQYFGVPSPPVTNSLWPIWQTEYSDVGGTDNFNTTIAHGLGWAVRIHDALVESNCAAWHYFVYKNLPFQENNESLIKSNDTTGKTFWCFAGWAKFVRPGFVRYTSVSGPGAQRLFVTAFRSPESGQCVIVVVNDTDSAEDAVLSSDDTLTMVPYRTSASQDLAELSPISVGSGGTTVSLPAKTMTTFVGQV